MATFPWQFIAVTSGLFPMFYNILRYVVYRDRRNRSWDPSELDTYWMLVTVGD